MTANELEKYMYESHDYTKDEIIGILESLRTDIYHFYIQLTGKSEKEKEKIRYYLGELNMIRICINLLDVIE